jgi:hypothetical protein
MATLKLTKDNLKQSFAVRTRPPSRSGNLPRSPPTSMSEHPAKLNEAEKCSFDRLANADVFII